jgi:hypothetical protein
VRGSVQLTGQSLAENPSFITDGVATSHVRRCGMLSHLPRDERKQVRHVVAGWSLKSRAEVTTRRGPAFCARILISITPSREFLGAKRREAVTHGRSALTARGQARVRK